MFREYHPDWVPEALAIVSRLVVSRYSSAVRIDMVV